MNIKILLILILAVVLFIPQIVLAETKPKQSMPFAVYTDNNSPINHFIPSGWMGDYGAVRINSANKNSPYSGATCIEITYTGEVTQGAGWVGIFWQNPENNWGEKDGGFNLSAAKKLSFWARGEKGGEKLEFKVGGITGSYPDSDTASIGPLELTSKWRQYVIELEGLKLFYISGGFVFAASRMDNPDGFIIYLDDMRYE